MKNFSIEIKEILIHVEEVTAKTEEEAINKVLRAYKREEIVLDCENFSSYEVRPLNCG